MHPPEEVDNVPPPPGTRRDEGTTDTFLQSLESGTSPQSAPLKSRLFTTTSLSIQ
jgi:hypothetical protein